LDRYGGPVATQAQRREATTGALRRAARTLFARRGFDAVAVDEIAAEAGVTRGAFYHHYDGKESLFELVFAEAAGELVVAVAKAAGSHADPAAQLRAGCAAFVALAASRRYRRVVLFDAPAVLGPDRYRRMEEEHFLGPVGGSLARLRPAAEPRELAVAARALMAALCALATHAAGRPDDLDIAAEVVPALLIAGIADPARVRGSV
jgi:AcrR family transcriptional regulator